MSDCTRPPKGWYCTRDGGHDGPCAALPMSSVERLEQLVRVFDLMPIGPTTPETRWSARDQRFALAFRDVAQDVRDALYELIGLKIREEFRDTLSRFIPKGPTSDQ